MLKDMSSKVAFGLLTFGLVTAGAATYHVSIHQDASVEGKEMKAGDYRIDVKENTATLKRGKQSIEVPVRVEAANSKFNATQIQYAEDNKVREIRIGGTTTKLVFDGSTSANSGM